MRYGFTAPSVAKNEPLAPEPDALAPAPDALAPEPFTLAPEPLPPVEVLEPLARSEPEPEEQAMVDETAAAAEMTMSARRRNILFPIWSTANGRTDE
jgi:hypothetical protein